MATVSPKRLSSHVLKAVLSVYFGVVLVVTALQLSLVYIQTKNDIAQELADLEKIFSEPLTTALWSSIIPQVESLASGIMKLHIVTGIEIINDDSGIKVTKFLTQKSNLFHRFDLFYTFEKNSVYLATVTVYSDSSAVFNRVKVGFFLLITQTLVISVVMMALFIWAIRKFLKIPLFQFVNEIEKATGEKNEGEGFDFQFKNIYDEFQPLVTVLENMGEKIAKQLQSIMAINKELERGNKSLETEMIERKQSEENLRISEQKYRGLVDNSLVGVFSSTLDGHFLFVNDAMARLGGFDSPELMMSQGANSLWRDPAQRERMLAMLQKNGSVTNFEVEIVTNADQNSHIIFSAQLLGATVSGMVMDVTERKQGEIKLLESYTEIKRLKKLLEEESSYLREEINLEHNYKNIIGNSDAIKYVLFKVEQVSELDTNVLVLGETGTGKELVARAIHHNSSRKNRPLIKVNCATLPSHLIESELFGHERGSFTSAHARHTGRFEVADGSSLFLDEIGELPLELQAKLLRVIEDGEFERLGSSKTIKVDVRIIAATNRDLERDVSEGRFRRDLWYRLNVFPITVPPLRERVEDIPLLVQYYLDLFNKEQSKHITSISVKMMKAMQSYAWAGNVRELVNIVERTVVNTSGSKLKLAEELKQNHQTFSENFKSLEDMERDYILQALEKTYWKISGKNSAAEMLKLNRGTLRSKMKKMDIHRP